MEPTRRDSRQRTPEADPRHCAGERSRTDSRACSGARAFASKENFHGNQVTDVILAQLEDDLCIDKTRIFATGFSFGGAMSLAVACQRADVFRGVAFFSGADLTGSCTDPLTQPVAYYASQASGDSSGMRMPSSGKVQQARFAEGHPTVYCIFNGPHGWEPRGPGGIHELERTGSLGVHHAVLSGVRA